MLSVYIHDKAVPMLVLSLIVESVEGKEDDEQSVSAAAVIFDLDSKEYQLKLRQTLVQHRLTCVSPSSRSTIGCFDWDSDMPHGKRILY